MQPDNHFSNSATHSPKKPNLLKISIIVAIALIIVIGVSIFFVFYRSSETPSEQAAKFEKSALSVASHPYLYACSTVDNESVKKITSTLVSKPDYKIFQTAAGLAENANGDLLQITKQKYANSVCTYGFGLSGPTFSDTLDVYLTQFSDNTTAKKELANSRPQNAKPLAGLADASENYYSIEQTDKNQVVSGSIIKDNYEIFIRLSLATPASETELAAAVTALLNRGLAQITSNTAATIISEQNQMCNNIQTSQLANDLDIAFSPAGNTYEAILEPTLKSGYTAKRTSSKCELRFQTPADKEAASKATLTDDEPKSDGSQLTAFDKQYPHRFGIEMNTFANASEAKKDFDEQEKILRSPATNGEARPKLYDTQIGDKAFFSSTFYNQTQKNVEYFYILDGKYSYVITITGIKQNTPFASKGYILSEKDAVKVFNKIAFKE